MASLNTKFSVGLFIIAGMTLAIVGVVWLGMTSYLQKGNLYLAYFDESVQGLDRDSAVKYRGVTIGRVHTIGIAPDEKTIEVLMQIEADIDFHSIRREITAQLKSVGITGLMFIEIDRSIVGERLTYAPPGVTPEYPVVPTRQSEITKFFQGIDDVFDALRALDTQAISDELVRTIQGLNRIIETAHLDLVLADIHTTFQSFAETSASLKRMADNADGGIDEIREALSRLETLIASGGADIQQIAAELKASARKINHTMDAAESLVANTDRAVDAIQRQAMHTLHRIDRAGDSLTQFLNRITDHPSQLFFSGPPVEKPMAP